eukprot:scaffold316292_cov31-Tisochrysis_lutea.AAC.2
MTRSLEFESIRTVYLYPSNGVVTLISALKQGRIGQSAVSRLALGTTDSPSRKFVGACARVLSTSTSHLGTVGGRRKRGGDLRAPVGRTKLDCSWALAHDSNSAGTVVR